MRPTSASALRARAARFVSHAALAAGLVCASQAARADIVGSWLVDEGDGYYSVTTFLGNGKYFNAAYVDGDPSHTGVEWGNYSWNALTGAVSATSTIDTNGDWGIAGDAFGPVHVVPAGDGTALLTQPACEDCQVTLTGVGTTSVPLVGSWFQDGDGSYGVLTFLPDGRYMQARVVEGDAGHTGIEWGEYSWNELTGEVTATSTADTNGDWGVAGDTDGPYFIQVAGSTATLFQPGCADCESPLLRVKPVPEPSTYALVLAGLGLAGVAARRRRAHGASGIEAS